MSHIVTIATKVKEVEAVVAACQRLGLAAPVEGTASLYSGEATGLIVQFSEWRYPIVIATATGNLHYDNFEGSWGNPADLDCFLQAYAVELVRLEARKKGHLVSEQLLDDGTIRLQIQEGHS